VSFLVPLAFWTAALVVPALLILYFLKLRRREQLVPSTLLWKRAVQDLQVNAPFQRLRKNLLLLLQLLVLLAAIFALARPIVETTVSDEESVVLLIDRSASMNTREGADSRLDLAKEQAVRLVKTLNRSSGRWFSFGQVEPKTRVMVIAFADRAQVVSPFTTNTSELVDLIRNIELTDGATNMREALELAEAYLAPPTMTTDNTPVPAESPSKLVLISDGGVADIGKLVLKTGTMELLKIGETRDNVGITTLRTRRNYERPEILDVFLQVQNFGPEPALTDVSLYVDGVLSAVKSVRLDGRPAEEDKAAADEEAPTPESPLTGTATSLSFELALDRAAIVEARISRDDALPVDDRAYAVVPPPRKLHVLLVSAKNQFLESVLAGLPLERLQYLTPGAYEAASDSEIQVDGQSVYDVVILDQHDSSRLPMGNYLFIDALPQIDEIKSTAELGPHMLMWWDETHPVLRHVALDFVHIAEGKVLEVPPEAETLIEGPRGPVLTRYAKDGRHYLILSFSIKMSDWVIKPSFPVFVYNALRYLGSGGATTEQGAARPGEALRIPLPAGTEQAQLTRPDGSKVTVRAEAGRPARYAGTHRVGVYRVEPAVEGRGSFAVNLELPAESDIAPRGNLKIGTQEVAQVGGVRTATPEIWRWFVGAALLIALFEWYIYNRRVMI
jgi:Ca-activated chloride channel family protein